MLMGTTVGVANPIVLRGRLVRADLALGGIQGPHFVDVLLGSAVDFVEIHVAKDLAAVVAEGGRLVSLAFLATTAAVDRPRDSHLSPDGDPLGRTAEAVFFRQLGLDAT